MTNNDQIRSNRVPDDFKSEPLTAEKFKEFCNSIMKTYADGRMTIQPDWYGHYTPCCDRRYETLGPCATKCPYDCGKEFVQEKYCPSCKVIAEWMNRRIGEE